MQTFNFNFEPKTTKNRPIEIEQDNSIDFDLPYRADDISDQD